MADETSAPTEINIGGYPQTTTAEAQSYARKFLDKQLAGNSQSEQAILGEMSQNSQRAVQALRQAQQSMMGAQYDPRLKWLAAAQALGEPTRSGSTSEGLGKAFGAAGEQLKSEQQFNIERMKAILDYQQRIAAEPDKLTEAKMALQKLHEQQEGPLAKEALQTMGRSIVPGNSMISPNAKVAASQGLTPGTPAFYARVKQLDQMDQRNKAATAGTDTDAYTEPDHTQEALKYGVPATAPYPWTGASTKERRQALQTERTSALKQMNVDDQGVLQARRMQDDIDRFMVIAKRHGTSSLQGIPIAQQITGLSQDAKEMDKISARLATLMRQPGWGRMTNYDLQLFQSATLGRDKPFETNERIADSLRAALTNQLDWNQFQHNYFAVHKTLQGARDAFDTYLDSNPIFDPTQPGQYQQNKGRVGYKTWFRSHSHMWDPSSEGEESRGPSKYSDVTEEDRNDPTFAGMSDEEIHNAKIPAKARGGPIRGYAEGGKVKADADYKATLEDLARSLEQGAAFQWGDELNAAASPGDFRGNVTTERGKQERFAGSHPWSNAGLEMAGGAASTAAAAKLLQAATEHGKGKAGVLGGLAALATKITPQKFLPKAAITGAAAGALSGAGSAQDAASVPGQALEQGAVGAVAGPLAGLVAKYGVNGTMALIDKLRSRGVPAGARKVIDALGQDKTTVDEIQTRLQRATRQGVPSNVANVGGPNIQALAQGVASKEGNKVADFVESARQQVQSSNERVSDLVNKSLKPDDYATKLKELTTNLYQNARPLYDQAYSQYPRVKSNVIWDILGNDYGKKAAKQAFKYMQADGVPVGKPDVTGAIKKPSLQYLDYVKRGLDDQIESAQRSGDTNLARILNGMKSRLVNELDAYTTDPKTGQSLYKAARSQYAGDAEVRSALQMGRDDIFGAAGMTPKDIATKVANMSWAERDAMRTGAAEYLFQMIGNTPGTSNVAAKLANVPNMQAKLSAMFDKPGEYQQFMSALQQEMGNFTQAKNLVATQARSKAAGASAALEPSGHLGEAAYEGALASAGHPLWAGARAAKWIGNRLMTNPTADEAAGILGMGGANRTQLDMLKQQAAQLAARQGTGNLSGQAVAGGMGPVAAPDPWGNLQEGQ